MEKYCSLSAAFGCLASKSGWWLVLLACGLAPGWAGAQEYPRRAPDFDRLAQELFAEIQSDQIPYEDLYGTLLNYYQSPLNLNTASPEELRALPLLREKQVTALLTYRRANGLLLSVYELQAVPGWDVRTIARVAPFVTVATNTPNSVRGPLWQRLKNEENNALLLRYRRVVQPQKGYSPVDTFQGRPTLRYLGSPDAVALRYRVSHAHDFSLGFTAEKDAGEPLAWRPGQNQLGPDFLSAHFVLYEQGKLKTLALGDYQLQFGQGLLLSSGLAQGKGAETITSLRRASLGVRPYAALLENTFFRGAAATYQLAPRWEATAFASRKNIDANARLATDSLAQYEEFSSSLLLTGLHRTATEIANRQRLAETVGGGHLGYLSPDGNLALGVTAVGTHYGMAFQKRNEPYNLYEFHGQNNLALGVHYSYGWRNLLLFGESGRSSGGGLGTVNGLLASLGPNVDAAVLARHYDADFHTFYGNSLGENTRTINESGFYVGLKVRPLARWEVSLYFDQFRFPWLRYRVSAPSHGQDALLRVAFAPTKTSLLYAQYRARLKPLDLPASLSGRALPLPGQQLRHSVLLYADAQPTAGLGLRTRLQATYLRADDGMPWRRGYILSQDASVQLARRVSLAGLYAVFDTDDYDTRQYVFEQDVLYAVSVHALYGQGTRAYLILQASFNKHFTLWLRYADTRYRHQTTVGSGLEETKGAAHSEVTAQVRYRF
ncbi:helix-hairpin-helix domain-containing protein [Hymenobacter ginsengisoli]|uniref:Helix-hairpin-helix domain-containing protein n=1 Tax=Hymenobacter ginsengisoli TaxID=1051626 RepID=A0ABP8QPC4_9BACT|nr:MULTISPECIES: helix-hairpin-helix domain-containing protein [unclassified Hymenobacter]MBO2032944.1 helix-hairpin-helix domain-containing protein [Hymenobacter sp. BT559]